MADTRTATGVCYTMSGSEKRYEDKISIEIVKGTTTLPTIKNNVVANENHYSFDADENCVYKSKGEKDETLPLIFVTYYPNKGQNPVYFNYNQYCTVRIKVNLVMPRTNDKYKYGFDYPNQVKIYYTYYDENNNQKNGVISLSDCYKTGIKILYGSSISFSKNCININEAGNSISQKISQFESKNIVLLNPDTSKGEIPGANNIIEYNIDYYNKYNEIIIDDTNKAHEYPGYYKIEEKERIINLYVGFTKFYVQPKYGIYDTIYNGDEANVFAYTKEKSTITTNDANDETHNIFKYEYGQLGNFGVVDVAERYNTWFAFIGRRAVCGIYPHYVQKDNDLSNERNYFNDIPVSTGYTSLSQISFSYKFTEAQYKNKFVHSNSDVTNLFGKYLWTDHMYETNTNGNYGECKNLYVKEYNETDAQEEFGKYSLGNITPGDYTVSEKANRGIIVSPNCFTSMTTMYSDVYTDSNPLYGIIVGIKNIKKNNSFFGCIGVNIGQISIDGCIGKPISLISKEKDPDELNYLISKIQSTKVYRNTNDSCNTFNWINSNRYGGFLTAIGLPGYRKNQRAYRFEMFFVNISGSKYNLKHALENWDYQPHTEYVK